jgi:hypothetical protein
MIRSACAKPVTALTNRPANALSRTIQSFTTSTYFSLTTPLNKSVSRPNSSKGPAGTPATKR